jgi:hypothetical protein
MMQFATVLMGGFATVALVLTVAGLYGVLSYAWNGDARRSDCGSRWARDATMCWAPSFARPLG